MENHVGHRKPTAGLLASRLAKMVLKLRGIRHGETRAVGKKGAGPQPTSLRERLLLHVVTHRPEQPLEDFKRESRTGLTRGRGGNRELSEVPQVRTSGIAVDDLDEKQRCRGHGIETSLSPLIADIMADGQDRVGLELGGPILLELFHHLGEGRWHG